MLYELIVRTTYSITSSLQHHSDFFLFLPTGASPSGCTWPSVTSPGKAAQKATPVGGCFKKTLPSSLRDCA